VFLGPRYQPSKAYTLIETAILNGINPQLRLAGTLATIPDYKINLIDDLPPWRTTRSSGRTGCVRPSHFFVVFQLVRSVHLIYFLAIDWLCPKGYLNKHRQSPAAAYQSISLTQDAALLDL